MLVHVGLKGNQTKAIELQYLVEKPTRLRIETLYVMIK